MCYEWKPFVLSRRLVEQLRGERALGFPLQGHADWPQRLRGLPGLKDPNPLNFKKL